jgi:uncharacterized SAM-binding protein YcdF (DUF218 family)
VTDRTSVPAPGRRGWRWRIVALLAVVAVMGGLPAIGTSLAVDDEPRPADAIVVTYSVMTHAGLAEVTRLYRAGLAPNVVLSDFESELMPEDRLQPTVRVELERLGVPATAIVAIDVTPSSEIAEAQALRRLFAERGWRSAIVLMREVRARRAQYTLRAAFRGQSLDLMMHPLPAPRVDLARWWTTRDGVNAIMNEWPRLIYYGVRGRY